MISSDVFDQNRLMWVQLGNAGESSVKRDGSDDLPTSRGRTISETGNI
jgi:hypothetical protein